MQTTFTRTERLVSGLYFAAMAARGFFALIIAAGSAAFLGYYLWAFPIGGFMAGIFIIPAIIKPDQFLKTRSFAAGCLTLLISCLTISFLLGIRGGIDLIKGLSLNWNDITFSFVRDWFENKSPPSRGLYGWLPDNNCCFFYQHGCLLNFHNHFRISVAGIRQKSQQRNGYLPIIPPDFLRPGFPGFLWPSGCIA